MVFPDRLRVAYVVKRYPRYSETFIVNEVLAHEAQGVEIALFSLLPPSDAHFQDAIARVRAPVCYLGAEGVRAADLWTRLGTAGAALPGLWSALEQARGEDVRDVYAALVLAQETRRRGLRHLHAHFATSATTVARLAARFAGLSYTFTAHAKDIFHESVQGSDLSRKMKGAAAVVTVSEYNRAYLQETFGAAAARVRRIYNGLDLAKFPYLSPRQRRPRILAIGRLVEKKGFADLIDACAILAGRKQFFTCTIVGGGEEEGRLRAQIARLALHDTVELLGPRPQSEIIELLHDSAVLAAPCVVGEDGNRDGMPTVLLEAMALGTPCVSTDVTGIPELLCHEETGLMAPQHDPNALAAALHRLLVDAELREDLARGARRRIEADFDIQRNAAEMRTVFEAAIAGQSLDAVEVLQEAG